MAECQRLRIAVLSPDVNKSSLDFAVEGEGIRFGLGAIKNVGEGPVRAILASREEGGPITSLDDFCHRVDLRQVNRRALESLIRVGALDAFGRREQLLAVVNRMIATSQAAHQAKEIGQLSMFGELLAQTEGSLLAPLPEAVEIPHREKLAWEKALLGLYISEHPLHHLAGYLEEEVTAFCGQIDLSMAGQKVIVVGMVTAVRTIITRRDDPMAFVQVEDIQGQIEVVVFPDVYTQTQELWQEDSVVLIKGRVDDRDGTAKIICESANLYEPTSSSENDTSPSQEERYHLYITVPRSGDQEGDIARLGEVCQLLTTYPGQDRFTLYVANGQSMVELSFPNDTTGYCVALERALIEKLGAGTVRVSTIS